MSWYETTSDRSITLCRALIGDNPVLLGKFDGVLRSHGFENLTIGAMKPVFTSQEEALRELQWLKEFLTNVVRRTCGSKQQQVEQEEQEEKEQEQEQEQQVREPLVSESHLNVREPGVSRLREDKPEKLDRSLVSNSPTPRAQNLRMKKSRADDSPANESQRMDEPELQLGDQKQPKDQKVEAAHVDQGIKHAVQRSGYKESQLPSSRTKPAAQRLKSRQLRREALDKRKLSDVKYADQQRIKQDNNGRKSRRKEESDTEKWCICRKPSAGLMLACDNSKCPIEWFHAKCVGLKSVPKSWYCPKCANRRRR